MKAETNRSASRPLASFERRLGWWPWPELRHPSAEASQSLGLSQHGGESVRGSEPEQFARQAESLAAAAA